MIGCSTLEESALSSSNTPPNEARVWRFLFSALAGIVILAHVAIWIAARSRWSLLWPPSPALKWTLLTLVLIGVAGLLLRRGKSETGFYVLLFLVFDLAFGGLTQVLAGKGIMQSYFPSFRAGRSFAFEYHPLLQGVPQPNTSGTFLMFGHRVDWAHDGHRLRRSKPLDPARPQVAVLGGSTTYDTGNSNETMWVNRVEELDGRAQFLNMGMPGYSSVEHLIQTSLYLPEWKNLACAAYYIGWNDVRNSHQPDLQPGYTNFHQLIQPGMLALRNAWEPGSPILTLAGNKLAGWGSHVPNPPAYAFSSAKAGVDNRLLGLYVRNLEAIAALNQKRGLRSVFIGQVLNYAVMTSPMPTVWMPTMAPKDLKPSMLAFNQAMRETAEKHGIPAIVLDAAHFATADFADDGHFSPAGAGKFARMVQPDLRRACFPE